MELNVFLGAFANQSRVKGIFRLRSWPRFYHARHGVLASLRSSIPSFGLPPREEPLGSSLGGLVRGWACFHGPAREVHLDNRVKKPGQGARRAHDNMNQSTFDLNGVDRPLEIACGEQPQQRFETYGAAAMSDTELIALLLHTGIRGGSVRELASRIIAQAGSMAGLATWKCEDFRRLKGIGPAKGRQLAALIEISRRMMKDAAGEAPVFDRPEQIAAHLTPIIQGLEVEKFWVFCLNRRNRLKKLVELTSGTATNTLAHPREVFRAAIQYGATAIICAHNHPSGDPAPSNADVQITRQLREASKAVDIHLSDHVVCGQISSDPQGRGYYSFRQAGML